jgi:hypothetical protein
MPVTEGTPLGPFTAGVANGIPITVTVTAVSIDPDKVVVSIVARGQGTSTTVDKTVTFIPRNEY